MKEHRKIFSAADVAAIRDGRKTMFREMVVPQPFEDPRWGLSWAPRGIASDKPVYCERNANFNPITKAMLEVGAPLGTIGDRIWIPEVWAYEGVDGSSRLPVQYKADRLDWIESSRWRSAAVMHRDVCRTFAEITAVRVERVQDITEEDAKKEGVILTEYYTLSTHPHRSLFTYLWQSRYGNWDANPWVWVYEFRRIKP